MNNKPDGKHWRQMCAEMQFIKFLRQTVDIFEEIIGSLKKKKKKKLPDVQFIQSIQGNWCPVI